MTMPPTVLWHIAPECAIESIKADGLLARPFVFAAPSPEGAWGFMAFRTFDHFIFDKGHSHPPTMHQHDTLGLFEIDCTKVFDLTGEFWEPSFDHSVEFFGDGWLTRVTIPPAAMALHILNRDAAEVHSELLV
jgi:hypothetical protein